MCFELYKKPDFKNTIKKFQKACIWKILEMSCKKVSSSKRRNFFRKKLLVLHCFLFQNQLFVDAVAYVSEKLFKKKWLFLKCFLFWNQLFVDEAYLCMFLLM